jgi:CBS domain-containing protein
MATTVRDVMTAEPQTLDAATPLDQAARQLRRWARREAPVTLNGKLRGVLTDSDIIVVAIASGHPPSAIAAGETCDAEAPRLSGDQPAGAALDYMSQHQCRRLPVVDCDDNLIGCARLDDLIASCRPSPEPLHDGHSPATDSVASVQTRQ